MWRAAWIKSSASGSCKETAKWRRVALFFFQMHSIWTQGPLGPVAERHTGHLTRRLIFGRTLFLELFLRREREKPWVVLETALRSLVPAESRLRPALPHRPHEERGGLSEDSGGALWTLTVGDMGLAAGHPTVNPAALRGCCAQCMRDSSVSV